MNHTFNPIIQEKLKEQDSNLNLLEEGIDRLTVTSKVIKEELNQQNKMLDTLEMDVTKSNTNIGNVNSKLNVLLKNTKKWCDCGAIYIILFLTVVAIILLLLILLL